MWMMSITSLTYIEFVISRRIIQTRPDATSPIPKFDDNTIIICYSPNHPVADVVVYSGGYINFISISISSYSVHRTKASDLFNGKVGRWFQLGTTENSPSLMLLG